MGGHQRSISGGSGCKWDEALKRQQVARLGNMRQYFIEERKKRLDFRDGSMAFWFFCRTTYLSNLFPYRMGRSVKRVKRLLFSVHTFLCYVPM